MGSTFTNFLGLRLLSSFCRRGNNVNERREMFYTLLLSIIGRLGPMLFHNGKKVCKKIFSTTIDNNRHRCYKAFGFWPARDASQPGRVS